VIPTQQAGSRAEHVPPGLKPQDIRSNPGKWKRLYLPRHCGHDVSSDTSCPEESDKWIASANGSRQYLLQWCPR
jgi:hypothetical protein